MQSIHCCLFVSFENAVESQLTIDPLAKEVGTCSGLCISLLLLLPLKQCFDVSLSVLGRRYLIVIGLYPLLILVSHFLFLPE